MSIILEFLLELFFDRSPKHPDHQKIESAYAVALLEPEAQREATFSRVLEEQGVKLSLAFEAHFHDALREGKSTSDACAFIR